MMEQEGSFRAVHYYSSRQLSASRAKPLTDSLHTKWTVLEMQNHLFPVPNQHGCGSPTIFVAQTKQHKTKILHMVFTSYFYWIHTYNFMFLSRIHLLLDKAIICFPCVWKGERCVFCIFLLALSFNLFFTQDKIQNACSPNIFASYLLTHAQVSFHKERNSALPYFTNR